MTLTVAEVLSRAADLIEPEGKWTQRTYARDAKGIVAQFGSKEAACWCAKGALGAVCNDSSFRWLETIGFIESLVPPVKNGCPIVRWNDAPDRTQAEVVAKLREASALAKERGL